MASPDTTNPVGDWEAYLSEPVRGRKVIVAFEVLAAMTRTVLKLERWGAARPLLLPDGIGTGPLPLDSEAEIHLLESAPVGTLTDQVRGRMQLDRFLTPELTAVVDAYDPDGDAVWWLGPPSPNDPLLGRQVLGGRPPLQAALEDKLRVDELLVPVGPTLLPAAVAPAQHARLLRASADIRAQTGSRDVVWVGDARDGINGGADYVRWIRTPDQAVEAARFFTDHCDVVRVTPFVEGVPCSIHGIVVADGTIVLRPVELAILRDEAAGLFRYAGMGTGWDPPHADRDEMRRLARRLGEHLRERFDYRGGFSIDGIMSADGFRPTEINTRFSGGLTRLAAVTPSSHLELLQLNALIGRDLGRSAAEIERAALIELDAHRFADAMGTAPAPRPTETVQVRVKAGEVALEVTEIADESVGTVSFGPSPLGGFVRLTLDPGVVRPGERTATFAALLYELSDRLWQTGLGALDRPPDVRR